MTLAREIASWSKDPSTKVGVVLVEPGTKRVLSTGYNGLPRRLEDRDNRLQDREIRNRMTLHAEENAVLNAADAGISVRGAYAFVYGLPPCEHCALVLIQAGIAEVNYNVSATKVPERWKRSCHAAFSYFGEAGVNLFRITIPRKKS